MRKLLILLMAVSLFAACNNDKGKISRDKDDRSSERDDYRDKDQDSKDSKSTDYTDDREKANDDRSSGSWSSGDVDIFVDNCVSEAVKGGMQKGKATDYCECMQRKLEVMYPNSQDVGNINVESAEMQEMVKKCLGM